MSSLYLHVYHGRSTPEESLDDWGADGGYLGPFDFLVCTYLTHLRVGTDPVDGLPDEGQTYGIPIAGGELLKVGDTFYGDWEVVSRLPEGVIAKPLTRDLFPDEIADAVNREAPDLIPEHPKDNDTDA